MSDCADAKEVAKQAEIAKLMASGFINVVMSLKEKVRQITQDMSCAQTQHPRSPLGVSIQNAGTKTRILISARDQADLSPFTPFHLFWPVSGLTNITITPSHLSLAKTVAVQRAYSSDSDQSEEHLYTVAGAAHLALPRCVSRLTADKIMSASTKTAPF